MKRQSVHVGGERVSGSIECNPGAALLRRIAK
jgi:hypothetical protein